MKVVEQFVCGRAGDPGLCEDVIVVTDDFAAVIDGVTDKTRCVYDGMLGGGFAATQLAAAFSVLNRGADLRACSDFLTQWLVEVSEAASPGFDPESYDGPSAVFVAYSVERREIWRIGDGRWLTRSARSPENFLLDRVMTEARAALLRALVLSGADKAELARADPGRAMITSMLRSQHMFRNLNSASEPLAYGAVDGRAIPDRFLEVWRVECGQELVLASDGYPELMLSLEQSEAYLTADLRRDPLRIDKHCSYRALQLGHESYDDRAYLRIAI